MAKIELEGLDPLSHGNIDQSHISRLVQESQKRDVLNILRSYTGTFDLFNEAIQNALDACQVRANSDGGDYVPHISIKIDMINSQLRVVDNGVGMGEDEARYFLRPGMSFKSGLGLRGQKGVGATFLAYGYSSFSIFSKQSNVTIAATLTGGRQWAENTTNNIARPKFSDIEFFVPELEASPSGSCIEISIGNHRDERPNFNWLNITDPTVWLKVLRLKTPLGGVYINSTEFRPHFSITVISAAAGALTLDAPIEESEFYYPHDFSVCQRQADTTEIQTAMAKFHLGRRDIPQKLPQQFRNLDCIWNMWGASDFLQEEGQFLSDLDEDQKNLIVKHDVTAYGSFVRSRTIWETFQKDELGIRPQVKIIQGGLQLASDNMVQGDLMTIPLTTAAGYQANSLIIIHFKNGNPDMGRKVFQPELKEIADILSRRIVAELRKFQGCLKADTGAQNTSTSKDLDDWRDDQKAWAKSNPLMLTFPNGEISLISKPREEQDVIALMHQMVGLSVFDGLKFFGTGYNTRYDGLYKYKYLVESRFNSLENYWGVDDRVAPGESGALVLEYKFSLDSLIRDFEKEEKNLKDINLVICWDIGTGYRKNYEIISYMIGQEGGTRENFGATHAMFSGSGKTNKLFEIICLSDFLSYYEDPSAAIARQTATYTG